MIDFIRHHWYDLGVIPFFLSLWYLRLNRAKLTTTEKFLLANFMAVLAHQFEEYRFPGGFPAAMNMGVHSSARPERFPLSSHSAALTNIVATYGYYLAPVFFPDQVWAALGPVLLGFGQFFIHGININTKLGSFYNPGLATVIFMHIPLGYYYIRHVARSGQLTRRQWALGLAYAAAFWYLVLIKSTFGWLVDYDSPYPFYPAEMERGGVAAWIKRVRNL
ncbi:82d1acc7-0f16-4d25-83ee-7272e3959eef [Thermothielavioides terrestris]|jgi:hypothetical protein|uniref:Uncharacterized protein n=2 Tax=Thermothielavioides terrestris TaxID=2587410 RepID=G2RD63_THETT|nr:uncharacterized protein THITE_2120659 [Thermothielavioides terrestris NRRL 8126]AEO69898.1 hypothetical protein THITE_2120659 [Thermothielavioides terrestris NRRL 8126]SPQ17693.1 82d1acc7-0f16-4d25-83ee-7272e3959eef [Thermothielavioides terrestris]